MLRGPRIVYELHYLLQRIVPSPLRDVSADRASSFLYLLFFAGETRGNMGPGDAGSVIIRVHVLTRAAEILWVASLEMGAPHLINVESAYTGLIYGLRRAKRSRLAPFFAHRQCR